MAKLILIRHGESEWNKEGKWTGWTDIDLDEEGVREAHLAAEELSDIPIDKAFSSPLIRAEHTLNIILKDLDKDRSIVTENDALREKNYGDYTGKNKWEVKKEVGDEEFNKLRRSWDYQLPHGESLKNVYERVVPYYESTILPELKNEKNVIVASHGNTFRAFVKYLDKISDEEIPGLEIATGEMYIYSFDKNGSILGKEIRATHPNTV